MNQTLLLSCFIIFIETGVILYLLGMVKDTTKEHSRALKSVMEDVLLALKARDSVEYSQSRAFQKDNDAIRTAAEIIPSPPPFDPSQAHPTEDVHITKDGKKLQIMRPKIF